MQYSDDNRDKPVLALTWGHRTEAVYRAIAQDPDNKQVIATLKKAWVVDGDVPYFRLFGIM